MDIQFLLRKNWQVELIHVLREANSGADFLANEGSRVDEAVIVLDEPPAELRALLAEDYKGTFTMRY